MRTDRVVLMSASLWLAGCTVDMPRPAMSRSACDLITASEASEIVGSAVSIREAPRNASSSSCFYKSQDAEVQLKVQWSGGKAAWEDQQRATALGGRLLGAGKDRATAGVMRAEEVKLGDNASYNPILGAYVLKGDVLLEFNNLITLPDARTKWEKLARTALSRVRG